MAKWDMEKTDLVPRGRATRNPAPAVFNDTEELKNIRDRLAQMIARGEQRRHPLDADDWMLLTNAHARLNQIIDERNE